MVPTGVSEASLAGVSGPFPGEDALMAAAFRSGADAIVIVDATGTIVSANPCARDLLGEDDLVGARVEDFVPMGVRPAHAHHREQFVESKKPRRMGEGLDLMAQRRDGTMFPVDIALSPVVVDGAEYIVASLRDVSALVEARADLESSRAQLAIMDDRQRIARDLHDTVIQDIFAAGLGLQAMNATVEDDKLSKRISSSVEQLDAAIARLRRVIFDLRARSGQDVDWHVRRVVSHSIAETDIEASIEVDGQVEVLSARAVEHLIATLREAVANVVRHADAKHMAVEVAVEDGRCALLVRDDGRGIDGKPGVGFGLDNMANRAEALGGGFSFDPADDGGSVVSWWVPVAAKSAQRS